MVVKLHVIVVVGLKRRYRIIDFKRNKFDIPSTVKTIEYDPNRTARIALLAYADGEKRYIIAPNGLKVGDSIISGEKVSPDLGNALQLRNMPLVHLFMPLSLPQERVR